MDGDSKEDLPLAGPLPKKLKADALSKDMVSRKSSQSSFEALVGKLKELSGGELANVFSYAVQEARKGDLSMDERVDLLTMIIDRRYPTGKFRKSRIVEKANEAIATILRSTARIEKNERSLYSLVDLKNRDKRGPPSSPYDKLVIDCQGFP